MNVFLIGLRGKQSFEKPLTIVDLTDMTHLLECCYALPHDCYFLRAIINFLYHDWSCISSVDDVLIVINRNKCTAVVEHTPILFDQSSEFCTVLRHELRQIEFFLELFTMFGLQECVI